MRYCKRCVYPENHPLGITFDDEGVCSGCRVHEEKDEIDWGKKREELAKLLKGYKNHSKNNWDCVIPVSGARDSYFIVDTVKNEFGLNPLLVSYNRHFNTDLGLRNLSYLRTLLGCDMNMMTLSPDRVKKLTRAALVKRGSMYWPVLAGQTVFPVQTAVRFKIPLIIWGAHQGVDQVGMFSHHDQVEMTRKYRKDHDLMGIEAEDLLGVPFGITEEEIRPWVYPHDKELEKVGVRGIYLNNYIRWDTKAQHEKMIQKYGYETLPVTRTFDTYNDVDCFNHSDVHDVIKFRKWGYGRVSDHVSREIRLKRLTREQGIDLVEKYENVPPRYLGKFLEWMGITENSFDYLIDMHRDPRAWEFHDDGRWTQKDSITKHRGDTGVDPVRLGVKEGCEFTLTSHRAPIRQDQYKIWEKAHVMGK